MVYAGRVPCWRLHPGLCIADPNYATIMDMAKQVYAKTALFQVYKFVAEYGGEAVDERYGFCANRREQPKMVVLASCYVVEDDLNEQSRLHFQVHEGRFAFSSAQGFVRPFFSRPQKCTKLSVGCVSVRAVGPQPSRLLIVQVGDLQDLSIKVGKNSAAEKKGGDTFEDEEAARMKRVFAQLSKNTQRERVANTKAKGGGKRARASSKKVIAGKEVDKASMVCEDCFSGGESDVPAEEGSGDEAGGGGDGDRDDGSEEEQLRLDAALLPSIHGASSGSGSGSHGAPGSSGSGSGGAGSSPAAPAGGSSSGAASASPARAGGGV